MSEIDLGTFAEYLRPIGPHMPPQLISPSSFANISRTAHVLPGALAMGLFGFECRLAEEAPVADFQLCADAAFNAKNSLARTIASGNVLLNNHRVWQRINDFVEAWSASESLLNKHLRNIWLEFDISDAPREVPVPSIFLGLYTSEERRSTPAENNNGTANERADPSTIQVVCLNALTLLMGNPVLEPVAQKFREAIQKIPAPGEVGFVGTMLARNVNAFRMIVRGLDRMRIIEYLSHLHWPGQLSEVEAALDSTSRFSDYLWLNIDVGEHIYPKISWECYFNKRAQPQDDGRWQEFLDYLVESEMCLPAKREGLLAYPAVIGQSTAGALWPDSLRLLSRALGPLALRRCVTALHHIKIVYQPGRPLEAKAYLCAHYE
ncbi:MAG: hypothetical protein WCD37_11935 [Chloroflexia bacterium]